MHMHSNSKNISWDLGTAEDCFFLTEPVYIPWMEKGPKDGLLQHAHTVRRWRYDRHSRSEHCRYLVIVHEDYVDDMLELLACCPSMEGVEVEEIEREDAHA